MNKLMQRLLIFVCMVCVCAACSRESMEAHTQDTKTSTNIISKALVETEEVKGDVSTKGIEQKNPSKLAAKKIIPSAVIAGKKATEVKVVSKKKPALAERLPPLPPKPKKKIQPLSQVLVRVNGVDITRGMVVRYADFMAALLRNKSPKITDDKLAKFKAKNFKRFSDSIYLKTILSTCLSSSNIVVSAEAQGSAEKDFLRSYGARKQTIDQLKTAIGKAGFLQDLETHLAVEAKIKTFLTMVHSNRYYIAEGEVAKHRANVVAFNKRAALTNEATVAEAKRIVERARKGEDFAKLISAYSQEPDKANVQTAEDCDEHDFEDDKHVWRALQMLKPGEVTEVLEIEDGYAIYKLIKKVKGEDSNTGADSLQIGRIFFRRAYQFPDQSDEEFRADVEKELRDQLLKDVAVAFRRQSKVERPNGNVVAE